MTCHKREKRENEGKIHSEKKESQIEIKGQTETGRQHRKTKHEARQQTNEEWQKTEQLGIREKNRATEMCKKTERKAGFRGEGAVRAAG